MRGVCVLNTRARVQRVRVEMNAFEKLGELFKKIGDEMEYTFIGRREDMWTPDRRPPDQRVYDRSKSVLSWGERPDQLASKDDAARLLATVRSSSSSTEPQSYSRIYESTISPSEELGKQLEVMADWADVPKSEGERTLSGMELAEMCFDKYGKYHDIGLVRSKVRLMGNKHTLLAVNFYVQELGGFGFRMTEEQYIAKLDAIGATLTALDQAWWLKKFLREPKRSRRGLPSAPREAFSVTLGLNESPTFKYIPPALIDELFGEG